MKQRDKHFVKLCTCAVEWFVVTTVERDGTVVAHVGVTQGSRVAVSGARGIPAVCPAHPRLRAVGTRDCKVASMKPVSLLLTETEKKFHPV